MRDEQHDESKYSKRPLGGGGVGRGVRPHIPRAE
jgi:hypothetical protein